MLAQTDRQIDRQTDVNGFVRKKRQKKETFLVQWFPHMGGERKIRRNNNRF